MKKADNFNASKWLVENKITTQSRLNEDLTDEIAALPNHHTAENTEEAILVVGKYAVVRYDESDEGGENMYVVWDNTVNQDEIGSYDDEPEFESNDPAEVAAFLKKNESLNENNKEASELLSLLASPEIKKYMDRLSDTLEDADFMRVQKLYDGLYMELKKHE